MLLVRARMNELLLSSLLPIARVNSLVNGNERWVIFTLIWFCLKLRVVWLFKVKLPVFNRLNDVHVPGRFGDCVAVLWASEGRDVRAEGRLIIVRPWRDVLKTTQNTAFPHALDLPLQRSNLSLTAILLSGFINTLPIGPPERIRLNSLVSLIPQRADTLHPLWDWLLLERCLVAVQREHLLLYLVVYGHVLWRHRLAFLLVVAEVRHLWTLLRPFFVIGLFGNCAFIGRWLIALMRNHNRLLNNWLHSAQLFATDG